MSKKILVIGDSCLDMYLVGSATGLSAEAPIPVVKQSSTVIYPGMAGNVARLLMDSSSVTPELLLPADLHIPVKTRLMLEDGAQLARWDFEDWCSGFSEVELRALASRGAEFAAIIVSDYGKGTVTDALHEVLTNLALQGIPLFVDTKGDPFRWLGLQNITLFPNEKEYLQWREHYDWMGSVVHKQGASGMRLLKFGEEQFRVAAATANAVNVCGAGDVVIARFCEATLCGNGLWGSLQYANSFAGDYVQRPFNCRYLVQTTIPDATGNSATL